MEINKIFNMDCLDGMRLMKEQGIKADWIITDPPYGISVNNNMGRRKGDAKSEYKKAYWDKERLPKSYFDLMLETAGNCVIFGGNYYTDYLPPTKSWIVWDKQMSEDLTFSQVELAWTNADCMSKIVKCFPNGSEKRIHPTQKPLPVIEWILNKYTKEGDLVCDPFMGSGTTAIACHKLKRRFIGFELDEEYFNLANKRLDDARAQVSVFDLLQEVR